jgi:hypothetical protein
MSSPVQPEPIDAQPKMERIWQDAVKAIHAGKGVTRADLDAYVHRESGGAMPSFAALTQSRMQHEKVREQQEQQSFAPSALATGAQSAGKQAALFGLLPKLAGMISPQTGKEMSDFEQAGEAAHPVASTVGGEVGAGVTGGLLGGLAPKMLGNLAMLRNLRPLLRAGVEQATVGGGIGAASGLAQPNPTPGDVAARTGTGALAGGILGPLAEHLSVKYNPRAGASHLLDNAIRENAPITSESTAPSFTEGLAEIQKTAAATKGLPPELQPPMALQAPTFTRLAARIMSMKSAKARATSIDQIANLHDATEAAYKGIANHPTEGYDAVLAKGDPIVASNPDALQIQKEQGLSGSPTARSLFSLYKKYRDVAQTVSDAREMGVATSDELEKGVRAGKLAGRLNDILQDVPGFSDLQSKVKPYFDQQSKLNLLLKVVKGRGELRGAAPPVERGDFAEGIKSGLGQSNYQFSEKVARQLVKPLMQTKDIGGLLHQIHDPATIPSVAAGGAASILGPPLNRARKWGLRALSGVLNPERE